MTGRLAAGGLAFVGVEGGRDEVVGHCGERGLVDVGDVRGCDSLQCDVLGGLIGYAGNSDVVLTKVVVS